MKNHNEIQKRNEKYLIWLKKPVSLSILIYFLYHIGFWILLLMEYVSFSIYEAFSKVSLNLNLNIAHDITDFLALSSAILFVSIMGIKRYNIEFKRIVMLKIAFYFSLMKLVEITAGENFSIPNPKMNTIDFVISDFLLILINFIIVFILLWVSNRVSPNIKETHFNKVIYNICIISFIFLLIILKIFAKYYL